MKTLLILIALLLFSSNVVAAGKLVSYTLGDEAFAGDLISPRANAPLVVLLHDWDGLTDYEVQRAQMLSDMGSADSNITMDRFASLINELEVAGLQHEMISYSGAPHAFSVGGC